MAMVGAPPASAGVAAPVRARSRNTAWARFRRHRLALLGSAILALFLLAAIFAPLVAGHDPNRGDLDQLRAAPSASHILGTDSAGRDVWA
ncbi:MAG: ABC transporter permease, partial [Chloroflexi bacterium]|nr:ABC transporter permease [Chloroflexota bacterium]